MDDVVGGDRGVGESGEGGDADLAAIAGAMVALRRAQARRSLARLSERRGQRAGIHADLPDAVFELLDAVATATERGTELTVTGSAAALGVDQPRASRLVASAVDSGLLRRRTCAQDGRRSHLVLTATGRRALARISAFRQEVIGEATAGWSARDRAMLAELLGRFVQDFTALTAAPSDTE